MEANRGRFHKRHNLVYYLKVYNDETGELLGHLVDITTEGLKLVAPQPLPLDRLFKLRLSLPEGHFQWQELRCRARSRWTGPDVNPDYHTTGFLLEEMDEETKDLVAGLVSLYSFHD
ncbi:MAG: PilZ domain-containing protein [Desulfurivibrio sp.]|nr:PilZ domain-containing protein [Desulfurivibrio sp.]